MLFVKLGIRLRFIHKKITTLPLLIILILFPLSLFSQNTLSNQQLPELTELNYDNLELQNWLPIYDAYKFYLTNNKTNIESRINLLPHKEQLVSRLLFSSGTASQRGVPYISGIFYSKVKDSENPVLAGQIGLITNFKILLKTLALGNFRLQAGEGLCLGNYSSQSRGQNSYIQPAHSLSHPSLTGAAAQLNMNKFNLIGWISNTQRTANLKDGKITYLYESNLYADNVKERINENTDGIIGTFTRSGFQLGSYYYHQSQEHGFADTTFTPVDDVYGLFASYQTKTIKLGMETALANDRFSNAFRFEYKQKLITNSIRYFCRPNIYPVPYAKTAQIFGQKTGSEELSWDMSYKLISHLNLISRIAAVKDLTEITDTHWKERIIFSAKWSEKDWQSGITYYRFKKDAVLLYDTLFTDILPTQNRWRLNWKQRITNSLDFSLACQYQHYLDQRVSKNGISLQQSVAYGINKISVNLSFLIWSNQKNVIQTEELLTGEDYLSQSDTDSAFRISLKYQFSNLLKLYCRYYRPIKHQERQSLWLNLNTELQ